MVQEGEAQRQPSRHLKLTARAVPQFIRSDLAVWLVVMLTCAAYTDSGRKLTHQATSLATALRDGATSVPAPLADRLISWRERFGNASRPSPPPREEPHPHTETAPSGSIRAALGPPLTELRPPAPRGDAPSLRPASSPLLPGRPLPSLELASRVVTSRSEHADSRSSRSPGIDRTRVEQMHPG